MEESNSSLSNKFTSNWAENLFFLLVGGVFISLIGFGTGNWALAIVYGSIAGGIIWLLFMTSVGEKIINFVMTYFAWCGGVPRADIDTMSAKDQLMYARTGATLFVPTILAFAGAYCVGVDVYHASPRQAALGALVWAGIIFTIDAALVSTMRRNKAMKYPLSSIFIRLMLALALGILISSVMELRIFEKEITEQYHYELDEAMKTIDSTERAEIAAVQTKIDGAKQEVTLREIEMRKEIDTNVGGRKANYGPVAKKKEQLWLEAKADYETNILPGLLDEIDKIQVYYQKKRDQFKSNFSDGLASRLEYLSNAGERKPVIAVAHLFIFIFLIVIELVPVLAKTMAAPTEYEHKKAQVAAEAEIATTHAYQRAHDATIAAEESKKGKEADLRKKQQGWDEEVEHQRIDAILQDSEKIHASSQRTGKNLDPLYDAVTDRILQDGEVPFYRKWWQGKRKSQPVA